MSSLDLLEDAGDLAEIVDEAGDFLISLGRYEDGLHLYRALELAPDDQELVNDLGWSLLEPGRLAEALVQLELAVAMDPEDALASTSRSPTSSEPSTS